ncbi:GGDEF domain-containing protein [Labrenzia sp. PHM005]|uniref:GGDEF domain-containing protein n=1 Tax=Labrenzia sp. PHM005 TaxID=2590016 RepID=UPI0011402934|nr:GGDEF domain-containing protein [Labrenzia sp. PHM005]QDG77835.1 GGDEF domain-containing protein [Labrenzia sp. PHM005]
MTLDTATLFAAISVIQMAGAVILVLFWMILSKRGEIQAGSLLWWIAGLLLGASSIGLIAMRGQISDFWSIGVSNLLLILAVGLKRAGVASILGRTQNLWVFAATGILWILYCSYPPFFESFIARINFIQPCLITLCIWIVWMAFFQNRDRLYSVTLLGVTSALEASGYLWYWTYNNLAGNTDALEMFADPATAIYLVWIMLALVMTIVLPVGMVIEILVLRYKEQAYQDPLTGLPNRRAFWNTCHKWLSKDGGQSKGYGLILFDIDQLKSVNDSFGHAMGDAVLQLFGRVVREAIGKNAFAGRLDGEEFVIFLPGFDAQGSLVVAQRVCRRFGVECEEATGGKLIVSAGAGLAVFGAGMPPERGVETAARALQKAKKLGRGQIIVTDAIKGKGRTLAFGSASKPITKRTAA